MSKPVHVSIRDDLRMRIAVGEWAAGERLPSETELAARYGVARMTVRQAIGALAGEGVVVRRQGLGTFAAERLPTRRVGALLSFTEEMRSQGRDVETRLIKTSVEQPRSGRKRCSSRRTLPRSPSSGSGWWTTTPSWCSIPGCPARSSLAWMRNPW